MRAFHVSEIGASHILVGKPCQDYAASIETENYAIAVVADGHGSDCYFRSDRGSRLAVATALQMLQEFLSQTDNMRTLPKNDWQHQLAASIISRWVEAIEKDKSAEEFTEAELSLLKEHQMQRVAEGKWQFVYGTTLIAIVRTEKVFFGMHIGDGKCVCFDSKGKPSQPIPWDDDCFQNRTTSLCDGNALTRFRFVYQTKKLPVEMFIASDGVDDTYATDERLYTFYEALRKTFRSNPETAVKDLQEFLPQMSAKGSKDDISIAGIIM